MLVRVGVFGMSSVGGSNASKPGMGTAGAVERKPNCVHGLVLHCGWSPRRNGHNCFSGAKNLFVIAVHSVKGRRNRLPAAGSSDMFVSRCRERETGVTQKRSVLLFFVCFQSRVLKRLKTRPHPCVACHTSETVEVLIVTLDLAQ